MQMWTRGISGSAANAQPFSMRNGRASNSTTGLHGDGAHVSVVGVVSIRMMQTNINAEIDLMILRIPPAGIDDLIGICRGVNRAIGNSVINTIVTVVPNPIAETVGPIATAARVTNSSLRRWRSWRRGRWTVLVRHIAFIHDDLIVECIVGRRVIENRFDRCGTRKRRIQKWGNNISGRVHIPGRGTAHT